MFVLELARGQCLSWNWPGDNVCPGIGQGTMFVLELARGQCLSWNWPGDNVCPGIGQGTMFVLELARGQCLSWNWPGDNVVLPRVARPILTVEVFYKKNVYEIVYRAL